jgi:flavin reductase (DIM6/NTAB) family NADH-FMN oxidoreductase RutF
MDAKNLQKLLENFPLIVNKLIKPGLLVVTGNGLERKNIMTIGWMEIGYVWREPVVTIAVRPSRHSYKLINEQNEFTVNIMPDNCNKEVEFCGAQSGAFCDKFNETKLHPMNSKKVRTVSIKEALMTIECKILNRNKIAPENLSDLILARYYNKGDFHDIFTASVENFMINKKS